MGESDGKLSLINVGDWSKPANTFIEKISDAIGGFAKPWQIRRVAEAEADAEKIHAVAQIEINKIQRRAMTRFIAEETKKQQNIEAIIAKALPDVSDAAKPENVEDDWIANFFDKCRLISDENMQKLWARILAGEANSPGRFSKRTIQTLTSLDKSDAWLFSKLCGFAFSLNVLSPIIHDPNQKIYIDQGIDFGSLSHLDSIGLVHFSSLTDFLLTGCHGTVSASYFDEKILIEFPNATPQATGCNFNVGKVCGFRTMPISVPG